MRQMREWKLGMPGCSNHIGIVVMGLLALAWLGAPHEASAQGQSSTRAAAAGPTCRPRLFYVTPTRHDGASALTACARGFHMASLWEIFDPSNLLYDTARGDTQGDAGFGPPNDFSGWIRTGNNPDGGGGDSPGSANCDGWTSNDPADRGTRVELVQSEWHQGARLSAFVQPWAAATDSCDSVLQRVWCVEDR